MASAKCDVAVRVVGDGDVDIGWHTGFHDHGRVPGVADLQRRALEDPERQIKWLRDPDVVGAPEDELVAAGGPKRSIEGDGVEPELVERQVEGIDSGGEPQSAGRTGERQLHRVAGEPGRGDEHPDLGVVSERRRQTVRCGQRDRDVSRLVGVQPEEGLGHVGGESRVADGREVGLQRVVDCLPGQRVGG